MGQKAKWEYFRAIYERYRQADRKRKHAILNEFCVNTGYHRKYAIRLLNGPPPGQAARGAGRPPATRAELQPGDAFHLGRSLGGGGISLVGAAESAATAVDAVDWEAVSRPPRDRAAIAVDQPPADGSPAAGEQDAAEAEDLWPDQAGSAAQAPDSGENRQLGCEHARIYRSGFSFSFGQFGGRRICAYPERDRHSHELDRIASGSGKRANRRKRGPE